MHSVSSRTRRRFIAIGTCGALLGIVQLAVAEPWGTNASVCPLGRCAPARQSYGFYPTKWRPWPGAVYPGMEQPAPQPGANQIPPTEIELPAPTNEAQIQTPNPANPARESAQPSTGGAAGGALPGGLLNEPMPGKAPANNLPGDALPAPKSAPGAMPEEPNFGPPSLGEPPSPSTRPGGSSRSRPRLPTEDSVAGIAESKSKDVTTLKLPTARVGANSDSAFLISPETEPELIVPSLSSRPLSTSNSTVKIDRSANNPLRDQARSEAVQTASLSELDSSGLPVDPSARSSATKAPVGPTRENPLRR